MSRFRAQGKPVEAVPESNCDVVTSTSQPVRLIDLFDAGPSSVPLTEVQLGSYTATNWGVRHANEDRKMTTADSFQEQLEFHTIGVLDGHDTEVASDLASRHLPLIVGRLLKEGRSVVDAYVDAMVEMESALKEQNSTAGTCVCSCTVAGHFVWCANLGDCRAVIIPVQGVPLRATKVNWLSVDQKASMPREQMRIRAAGGTVADGRVEGLEPSRTLGDFDVKLRVNEGVISIVPEVRRFKIGDGRSPAQAVLVIATDGVWDVMTGQDICKFINARTELASSQHAVFDLAEDLVQFSVARGSRDDCTAVVALISVQTAEC